MRIRVALATLFMSASLCAGGQTAPAPAKNTDALQRQVDMITQRLQVTCPIGMRVSQQAGSKMMAVDKNGAQATTFAARLRLLLNDTRAETAGKSIVRATVNVHGSNGKARLQPVDSAQASSEMETTLTVSLADWGEPGVSGDLKLPGFVSASRVDLESITYADGSVWKLAKGESCRVAPDPLMLIAK